MGIGYCSKCNSFVGGMLACLHVVAAARSSAPRFNTELRRFGYVDDKALGLVYWVEYCLPCIDRLGLPPDETYASEAVVEAAVGETQCVCGPCLRRWLGSRGGM